MWAQVKLNVCRPDIILLYYYHFIWPSGEFLHWVRSLALHILIKDQDILGPGPLCSGCLHILLTVSFLARTFNLIKNTSKWRFTRKNEQKIK